MTEMSTRERVAAADREAAREAYEAHKEQERSWRSKAIAHEEAEAASRTGGSLATESGHSERKQLGINVGAADSYPRKTWGVQIERPTHEGSNALTGTALGDKIGAAYAPPMEGVEEAGAAQPLAGELQGSDDTPADNTSKATEENNASKQSLPGKVGKTNDVAAGHSSTTAETQSDNPLLTMNDEDLATGLDTELSMLQQVKTDGKADDSWDRRVLWVYTSWQEWISCGNTLSGHFDKLKPMVDSMFTTFRTRCGKRRVGLPADLLDKTLAIVSVVRDDMTQALDPSNGTNSGQSITQDQLSVTEEQLTSDLQSSNDEQLSHDQEQIAQDRESAEILEQQLLQQEAQISSDHELAKSLDKQAPQQTYIQGNDVDQQTRTRKQNYPETAVASGSGTYPRKEWASQRVDIQAPDSPWIRPTWLPKPVEQIPELPKYKAVTLASEQSAQGLFYIPAGDDMIVHTEQINTGPINTSVEDVTIALEEQSDTGPVDPPTNPLLEQHPSEAWKMLDSWLDEADSSFKTLTHDEAEAWFQGLNVVVACWSHWITHRDDEIWGHVEGRHVIQLANIAFDAHGLIKAQSLTVTDDVIYVCQKMSEMKHLAEMEEQARIKEEQRQESMCMTQLQEQQQQQQQLAQKLAAEEHEEQACINEEERQKSVDMAQTQSQQQPWTPPPMENEEDLYDLSPPAKEKRIARARPENNATSANEPNPEANALMGVNRHISQPNAAVQQHVGDPLQSHQQVTPALVANVDAMPATRRNAQTEPQVNTAHIMAFETTQVSQVKMDTTETETESPKVRLDVQKVDLQNNQFSFAINETHRDTFNKNLKAENAASKSAADRISLKDGRRVDSGNGEALFVSDDVQKRHQDDLRAAQAKAEADVAAAHKADDEALPVAVGTTTTATIPPPPTVALPRSGSDSSLTSFESSGDEGNTQPKPTTGPPQALSSDTVFRFSTGPPIVQQEPIPGSEEDNAKYRREQAAKCFPPNIKF
jgi:hypothetical protein